MANAGKITEIIDDKAFQQWSKFVESLERAQTLMAEAATSAMEINKAMGNSKNISEYSKNSERAALAQERIRKATAQAQQAEERLAASRKRNQQADERAARQEEARRARAAKQRQRETSEYARLDAQLTKVRTRAQDVAAAMFRMEQGGIKNEKAYARLQRRLENLTRITTLYDNKIKGIDANLGKYQRNVGNYASGWNGLSMSINQLTREAPAFAVSFQTGILALSNNIPILADEITKLRAANAALAAEGKKTIPVWRQIIRSFLTWQTVLSLSVTVITLYGKEIGEFISNMFGARKAIDQARAAQEGFNESLKSDEFKDAIKNVLELRNAVELANDGLISQDDAVRRYNETIGQTAGELQTLSEVEQFLADNANQYIQFTLNKAAANLQLAKAAEVAAKIQEDSTKHASEFVTFWDQFEAMVRSGNLTGILNPVLAGLNEEYRNLVQRAGEERQKAMVAQNIKDRDVYIANAEKLFAEAAKYAEELGSPVFSGRDDEEAKKQVDTELKLQQFRAQVLAENNRKIAEDEKLSFDERAKAADEFAKHSEDVINIQKQMDQQMAEGEDDRILASEKAAKSLADIGEEYKDLSLSILMDQLSEEDRIRSEAWANRKLQLEQEQNDELQMLQQLYLSRQITEKEYQEQRKNLSREYTLLYISQEIDAMQELIDLERQRGKNVAEQERELARLRIKYSQEASQAQIDDLDKVKSAEEKIAELKRELAKELFNLGVALLERQITLDLQNIERQENELDERLERERRAIEVSALSEEEKQQRIIGVEKRAEAEREKLEARRRQAETRQARLDKGVAILRATVNTAAGVARAFADYAFPYSAIIAGLVGALGAVQIATISAAPIPQYFKGTDYSREGIAHVGERGTELIRYPDGTEALTPNRDTLTWLPGGSQVLTNDETKRYLAKQAIDNVGGYQSSRVDLQPLINQQKLTNMELKKLQKRKSNSTVLTRSGLIQVHRNGNKWSNYLKRNGL